MQIIKEAKIEISLLNDWITGYSLKLMTLHKHWVFKN